MSTRAIIIEAPASAVWRGSRRWVRRREEAHTYDWIENLLGLNMHSVDRVLPQFEHPEVGETLGFGANRMRLARVETERVFAWRSEDKNRTRTFALDEH